MADIADNVLATLAAVKELTAAVTTLTTTVQNLTAPDLSGINAKLDTLLADVQPTPAPAPEPAPDASTAA